MEESIIEITGWAAVLFCVISYFFRNLNWLLFFEGLATVCSAAEFFMLGEYTGAVIKLITLILLIAVEKKVKISKGPVCMIIFLAAVIVTAVLTWNGSASLFALLSGIINVLSFYVLKGNIRRLLLLAAICPLYIAHDVIIESVPGIAEEVISMIHVVVTCLKKGFRCLIQNEEEEE